MKAQTIQKFQQGDVIIKSISIDKKDFGKKLNHLILQKSDVSGHAHRLIEGKATLFEARIKDEFYLEVSSKYITIAHEEHKSIIIPKGKYYVYGVKEFDPFEDEIRRVRD